MVSGLSTVVLLLTLYTDTVQTQCSTGCIACSGSTCSKCDASYYLSSVFCSPCPEQCTNCNGYDNCISCKPGKYGSGSQCQFNCADGCYNEECQYDTGFCVQCKPGQYGLQCQHDCSLCEGDLCDVRSCTHGCKQGYYEYNTGTESICLECPSNCRHCIDKDTCRMCDDDFHLYQFHSNGKVFVNCIGCSVGSYCSNYCVIQNCNQCKIQHETLVCTDCSEGSRFNGKSCIFSTTGCSKECSSYCDDDGLCLGNCNAGWTGDRCSEQCSDKCFTCDKINQDICKQCKSDLYSVNCNMACSPSCSTEEGKQTCRLHDGYCLNGCQGLFWGPMCGQSCSNGCINSGLYPICERINGTCKHGCKAGYTGDKCDITATNSRTTTVSEAAATTQKQVSSQEFVDCKSNFVEGFFSGLGAAVVVVAITLVLFQVRRRYVAKKLQSQQNSKKTTSIEIPTYYNENVIPTHETREQAIENTNYEQLGHIRNTDNVYNDLEATTVE